MHATAVRTARGGPEDRRRTKQTSDQNTTMRENENPDKLDPRELTKQQHNVLDATRLLEREAPRLIRSAATITYELHQWRIDTSYGNV